ncbi:MAG: cell envelope integrity protein TolA [Gammaproteobacteria bacterium]|nr:cell envelope integrity protein TolA [Gammaproteobacteria bacterium]
MLSDKSYKKPFIYALLLHLVVFGLLFMQFATHHTYTTNSANSAPKVNIVRAVAVDQAQVEKQIAAIKAEKRRKKQQELARIRRLHAEALAAKRAKEQEQKRLKALKIAEQHKKLLAKEAKIAKEKAFKVAAVAKERAAIQQAMQKQIAAEQKQMAASQANQGEIDKYKALILAAISEHWIVPVNAAKNLSCQLLVHVAPNGKVLTVDLAKSSGNAVLDRSARAAVLQASPLPVPKNRELFDNFSLLRLTVKPEGFI